MRKIKKHSTPKEQTLVPETIHITVREFLKTPTRYIYSARKGVVTIVSTFHGDFLITPISRE
jgi:hypothetical protein